ncbi:hypothetical protein E2C01_002886 [Portunus trituberculatus]|uniref:Secreted protein n=1 Tax=Portunus trituberculatus TaxID=210409 RepID=A0A5B7CNP9_PORTR|nr:hypothetical protein [Portunus trituberculatus]
MEAFLMAIHLTAALRLSSGEALRSSHLGPENVSVEVCGMAAVSEKALLADSPCCLVPVTSPATVGGGKGDVHCFLEREFNVPARGSV